MLLAEARVAADTSAAAGATTLSVCFFPRGGKYTGKANIIAATATGAAFSCQMARA